VQEPRQHQLKQPPRGGVLNARRVLNDLLARAVVLVALGSMLGVTIWAFQRELALTTCSSVVVRDTHYIICTRPSPEAAR
jgi:hypothetical protein